MPIVWFNQIPLHADEIHSKQSNALRYPALKLGRTGSLTRPPPLGATCQQREKSQIYRFQAGERLRPL